MKRKVWILVISALLLLGSIKLFCASYKKINLNYIGCISGNRPFLMDGNGETVSKYNYFENMEEAKKNTNSTCEIKGCKSKYDISNTYAVNEIESYTYEIIVKQYNGKTIISEQYYHMCPIVQEIGKDEIAVTIGRGDYWGTRFINVRDGRVSEQFEMVAYSDDKVVYPKFENGVMKIVVQDRFDKNKYYYEIIRDYAPVAVGKYMIIDVEFINETTLCLQYFSGEEWEEVKETINLRFS